MNADFGPLASALATLLSVLAYPSATEGAGEAAERRPPPQVIDPTPGKATELSWRNGEKLVGAPFGADETHFQWQSALFTEPIILPYAAIDRVDFAADSKAPPQDADFRFLFADGSHLSGNWTSIDGPSLSLTSSAFGETRVRLDQLLAIERLRGSGIVAAGPASLFAGDPNPKRTFPCLGSAGSVVFLDFNLGIRHAIELPAKCRVRLRLRFEGEPAFSLLLAGKSESVGLETWGDELVLTHRENFASAGSGLVSKDGLLDVTVTWDQTTGTVALFDNDGTSRAELTMEKEAEKAESRPPRRSLLGSLPLIGEKIDELMGGGRRQPERATRDESKSTGVTLTNGGEGFVVEAYAITDSPDAPPLAIPGTAVGVETSTEFISGTPVASNGTGVTVQTDQGAREVPLAEVRSVRWPRPALPEAEVPQANLWYSNGDRVQGTILGITDGKAEFRTPFASDPLRASIAGAIALVLSPPPTVDAPDGDEATAKGLGEMDTIATGELSLHGTLQSTGGVLPGFIPVGSETALTPVAMDNLVLVRHLSEDGQYQRAPALLVTRASESLPVTVDQITADKIAFRWETADAREVSTSEIHAIQFPEPAVDRDRGFEAEGWRFSGKRRHPVKDGEKGVVLEPDSSLGHPYLLRGEDFSFRFRAAEQQPSFRIRLFCRGTDRNSASTNFLVAQYGNTVYAGPEQGQDGQFTSNQSFTVDQSDKDGVLVACKFNGPSVQLLVNNMPAGMHTVDQEASGKSGAGLIIEPTSLWGNSFGAVVLSDFVMSGAGIGVAAPSFADDAKSEALLLPRTRRDVPPRHILIGRNGDLLRGEIEAKSGSDILLRVGLDHHKVPIERVAAAVWVGEADATMDKVTKKPAAAAAPAPAAKPARRRAVIARETKQKEEEKARPGRVLDSFSTQWLDLTNGGRMKVEVEAWTPEGVIGTHAVLGPCRIPSEIIHRVSLGEPVPSSAQEALSHWKFENTLDPNPPGQDEADVSPLVGTPAPRFTLKMLEGEDFKLTAAKGKVVVLDFWASWCAPCVRSLPLVLDAMAGFPPDKVAFLAVNQGETPEQVKQFMNVRGFVMSVGFDPEMKVGKSFGVESIPYTVVIDPTGTVTYVSLGASPDGATKLADAVKKALDAAASE